MALRTLAWESEIAFSVADDATLVDALPALQHLSAKSPEIFPVLAQMDLPNLTHVGLACDITLCSPFLQRHGGKLVELVICNPTVGDASVFALCPNIMRLTLEVKYDYACWASSHVPPFKFSSCNLQFSPKHQCQALFACYLQWWASSVVTGMHL
ncbi:hypothetical protein C8R44DRAFT_875409 [Mycena epipterygia]|nr:hypothetical protein C8R44DRAFT_875409 [Mycena epipterygia]